MLKKILYKFFSTEIQDKRKKQKNSNAVSSFTWILMRRSTYFTKSQRWISGCDLFFGDLNDKINLKMVNLVKEEKQNHQSPVS